MSPSLLHTILLTVLALVAFAGNSVLCRLTLARTAIDPASFSSIRLASGTAALWLIVRFRHTAPQRPAGSWPSACALFVYVALFSFAYVTLPTGAGAFLLFGAVQATMIGAGLWAGERMSTGQWGGFGVALSGLVALVLPGLSSPPLGGSVLMLAAGVAWGIYSLRGWQLDDPAGVTAGNFLRTLPLAGLLSVTTLSWMRMEGLGVLYAVLSGALASGVGYAVWYAALARVDCHPRCDGATDCAGSRGARRRRVPGRADYIAPGHGRISHPRRRRAGSSRPFSHRVGRGGRPATSLVRLTAGLAMSSPSSAHVPSILSLLVDLPTLCTQSVHPF